MHARPNRRRAAGRYGPGRQGGRAAPTGGPAAAACHTPRGRVTTVSYDYDTTPVRHLMLHATPDRFWRVKCGSRRRGWAGARASLWKRCPVFLCWQGRVRRSGGGLPRGYRGGFTLCGGFTYVYDGQTSAKRKVSALSSRPGQPKLRNDRNVRNVRSPRLTAPTWPPGPSSRAGQSGPGRGRGRGRGKDGATARRGAARQRRGCGGAGVGMREPRNPWRGVRGSAGRESYALTSARSSVRARVLFGSTGMPGPMVVVKVIFFR
jgi:hypothetical protein